MFLTPCVSLCKINEGKCQGCGRTLEEIAKWRKYTDEERLDIMRRLLDVIKNGIHHEYLLP
jgi:predicted Fe-S protein YdhL (DUF1289 family)